MNIAPKAPADIAASIIDQTAYADWDRLLDMFERLHCSMPVARIENGDVHEPFTLITAYDDVMQVSKDNKTFLNNPKAAVFNPTTATELVKSITGGSPHLVESLVQLDAPIHPKYRELTREWFMPKNLATLEAEMSALAKATVDRLLSASQESVHDEVDFVPLVSAAFPIHVIMQILGVPEEDEARMLMLTQQLFGSADKDLNNSGLEELTLEQIAAQAAAAVQDFEAYFAKITESKRANPSNDVASTIANAKVDGKLLSDRAMAGYYIIVATAGHDTTSASIAGAMLALAQDPMQWLEIKQDRSLLPGLIEEAIRWTTPVQHFMRTAVEDTEIGGVSIPKGEWLMISYIAANHDERVFEQPRKFNAARSPNRHLAFGAGGHQCLGLHLARLEMKILFNELFDRIESIELAGEPKRVCSSFVGGLKTLPIKCKASD